MKDVIPRKTIYRLSVYHRCLEQLGETPGGRVSSEALAKVAGVKPTQLRKDLAYFGQLGRRGIGYDAPALRAKLGELLGTTRLQPVILVGVGNLGTALLGYTGFAKEGFEIVAAFDAEEAKVGRRFFGVQVHPAREMQNFVRRNQVKMAILTVPGNVAQTVCNKLIDSGIEAILNFAPIILQVPDEVMVNNVNLAIELENLSYFIR